METIKKYLPYIICIGLLIALLNTCTNQYPEIGETEKKLHQDLEQLNSAKIKTERIKDSLHKENQKKDKIIADLKARNTVIDSKIVVAEKDKKQILKKVDKFTYKEDAEYIAKQFNSEQSVNYDSKGVTVKDSVPKQIVRTIVELDFLRQKDTLTQQKIVNLEDGVKLLQDKVKNKDLEIKTISDLSLEKDTTLTAYQDLNKSLKKENRKLKLVDRVLMGVAAVIAVIVIVK